MSANHVQRFVSVCVLTCSATMLTGCNYLPESGETVASKKGIEKYLVDPGTVQYRNISNAKSLDGLKFQVDRARVSEMVREMTASLRNFPGVPYYAIQAQIQGAELNAMAVAQKEADKRNAEIANGSLKGITGTCLEFNAKNKSGGYTGFETALCLHRKDANEAECLNISLEASKDILSANLSDVCK